MHGSVVSSSSARRLLRGRLHRDACSNCADEGLTYQSPLKSRSAIKSTIGEKSTPPVGGINLRIGASAGSVRLNTSCTKGCRLSARTQDMTTAARTTSEYRSISAINRRIKIGSEAIMHALRIRPREFRKLKENASFEMGSRAACKRTRVKVWTAGFV